MALEQQIESSETIAHMNTQRNGVQAEAAALRAEMLREAARECKMFPTWEGGGQVSWSGAALAGLRAGAHTLPTRRL